MPFKKGSIPWNKNNGGYKLDYHLSDEERANRAALASRQWRGKPRPDKRGEQSDVWNIARPTERPGNHPTPKPVELVAKGISNSSKSGDIVVDTFLGSGSTLIACEQTDRTCYGMELDEKYLDVIRKRWAKYVYPDRWEKEWEILTPAIEKL